MRPTTRGLRLLPAIMAVWCLGCESLELIVESLIELRAPEHLVAVGEVSANRDGDRAGAGPADGGVEAADSCNCALGHAADVSVAATEHEPAPTPVDFVDVRRRAVLPAPEPPLRPPVA